MSTCQTLIFFLPWKLYLCCIPPPTVNYLLIMMFDSKNDYSLLWLGFFPSFALRQMVDALLYPHVLAKLEVSLGVIMNGINSFSTGLSDNSNPPFISREEHKILSKLWNFYLRKSATITNTSIFLPFLFQKLCSKWFNA